jgi:hypothetical protein
MVERSYLQIATSACAIAVGLLFGGAGIGLATADTGDSGAQSAQSATGEPGQAGVQHPGPLRALAALRTRIASATLPSRPLRLGPASDGNTPAIAFRPSLVVSASTVVIRSPLPVAEADPTLTITLPGPPGSGRTLDVEVSGVPLPSEQAMPTAGSNRVVVTNAPVDIADPQPASAPRVPGAQPSVAPPPVATPIALPDARVSASAADAASAAAVLAEASRENPAVTPAATESQVTIGAFVRSLLNTSSTADLARAALPGLAVIVLLSAGGVAMRLRAG